MVTEKTCHYVKQVKMKKYLTNITKFEKKPKTYGFTLDSQPVYDKITWKLS